MNKLRILPAAFVCGLASSLALAQQLITVGPNTPGVTESVLLLEQSPTPPSSPTANYEPVFSNSSFVPYSAYADETNYSFGTDCLHGCTLQSAPGLVPSFFGVHFNTPVSYVSVALTSDFANEAFIQAFNSSGALIGSCAGLSGTTAPPYPSGGCFSVLSAEPPDGEIQVWQFALAAPGISTVLATSFEDGLDGEPGPVKFRVPEPATLGLMLLGLAGVGFARRKASTVDRGGAERLVQNVSAKKSVVDPYFFSGQLWRVTRFDGANDRRAADEKHIIRNCAGCVVGMRARADHCTRNSWTICGR